MVKLWGKFEKRCASFAVATPSRLRVPHEPAHRVAGPAIPACFHILPKLKTNPLLSCLPNSLYWQKEILLNRRTDFAKIKSQSVTYVSRFATGHMVGLLHRLTMNALEFPPRSVLPNVWLKIKPSRLGNRPTSLVNVLPRSVALSAEKNSRQKKARSRAAVYL